MQVGVEMVMFMFALEMLNFSLVWNSDKNDDKKLFHVSLSNSCLGGVNDYTSDVNISYETRKWLYLQED